MADGWLGNRKGNTHRYKSKFRSCVSLLVPISIWAKRPGFTPNFCSGSEHPPFAPCSSLSGPIPSLSSRAALASTSPLPMLSLCPILELTKPIDTGRTFSFGSRDELPWTVRHWWMCPLGRISSLKWWVIIREDKNWHHGYLPGQRNSFILKERIL